MNTPENNPNLAKAVAGEYNFVISDILHEGWKKTKGIKGNYWLAVFITALTGGIAGFLLKIGDNALAHALGFDYLTPPFDMLWVFGSVALITIIVSLITLPMYAGVVMIGVNRAVDGNTHFSQIIRYFRYWYKLFLAALMYDLFLIIIQQMGLLAFGTGYQFLMLHTSFYTTLAVILFISGLLLIFTLLYLLVAYSFFAPLVVEKKLGPWNALEMSRRAVSHHWFKIFGLIFACVIGILISVIPFGIGLIWSLPAANNIRGVAYRDIFGVDG